MRKLPTELLLDCVNVLAQNGFPEASNIAEHIKRGAAHATDERAMKILKAWDDIFAHGLDMYPSEIPAAPPAPTPIAATAGGSPMPLPAYSGPQGAPDTPPDPAPVA